MPLTAQSVLTLDPDRGRENDQFAPLYVSSMGRYLWSERPFVLEAKAGRVECRGTGEILLEEGFGDLRGAYLAACRAHFPFTGTLPDRRFFTQPQYNTWIELGTDQTTENILRYARGILAHGLPAGILMIDGGWQEDYGVFEFHKGKIPDPAYLMYELHRMGFGVMIWTSPIVGSAGTHYKRLRDKGYLLLDKDGEIAIRKWWSGYSAVLDLSNPEAAEWYHGELHRLMDCYGVDGYKFDAGDVYFFQDSDRSHVPMLAREQTAVFNEVGSHYSLNEFRAAWKFGGQPIVARLHDKYHSWNDFGLNTLIPHTLLQGLLGYAYSGLLQQGPEDGRRIVCPLGAGQCLHGNDADVRFTVAGAERRKRRPGGQSAEAARFSRRNLLPTGAKRRADRRTHHPAHGLCLPGTGLRKRQHTVHAGRPTAGRPGAGKGRGGKDGLAAGRPLEELEGRNASGRLQGDAARHAG